MNGIIGMCSDPSESATYEDLTADTILYTSGDTALIFTCGFKVEYEWSGFGEVYFEINSNQALKA